MAIISTEHEWPPPYPDDEKIGDTLNRAYLWTYRHLLDLHEQFKCVLGKTRPKHLILNVQTAITDNRFRLYHGLIYPRKKRSKKKEPFYVDPIDSLNMLNNLSDDDAEQIARRLCLDYTIDAWNSMMLEKELDEEIDEIEKLIDEPSEPWAVRYDWEEGDQTEEDVIEEEEVTIEDPDFQLFFAQQEQLRPLYDAILRKAVDNTHIHLTPRKSRRR